MKFEEKNSSEELKKNGSSLMRRNFVLQASFVYVTLALISLSILRYGQKNIDTIFSIIYIRLAEALPRNITCIQARLNCCHHLVIE